MTELRKRNIEINLTDKETENLITFCGVHKITVQKLVECFIADLVESERSGGSDECMYVGEWFNRCDALRYKENSLLNRLLERGLVDEYLEATEEYDYYMMEITKNFLSYTVEEMESMNANVELLDDELDKMTKDWVPDEGVDMNEEIKKVKKWQLDKEFLEYSR